MNVFIILCLSVIVYADGRIQRNGSFTKSLKTRNSSTTPKPSTKNDSLKNTINSDQIRLRFAVRPKIGMFCWISAIEF